MVRDTMEQWWEQGKRYLDEDFPKKLSELPSTKFRSRLWEMRLAILLLEEAAANGYTVAERSEHGKKGKGPDFLVRDKEGQVWIEAVALTRGDEQSPDRVPETLASDGKLTTEELPNCKIDLRISTSIASKLEKMQEYIDDGIIGNRDRVVIAVNCGEVTQASEEDGGSPVGVVYPFGKLQHTFAHDSEDGYTSYQPRFQLLKSSGKPVETGFFAYPEFSYVSGVIWSTFDIGDCLFPAGVLCYFSNPFAKYPLKERWMNWNYEWTSEVTTVDINRVDYHRDRRGYLE